LNPLMEINIEKSPEVQETNIEFDLDCCDCLSKICGCEVNSTITKGFSDYILEYFHISDVPQGLKDGLRFNVIHLWGTTDSSTKDLENWLSEYTPFEIEWINDFSCNLAFKSFTESLKILENYTEEYEADNEIELENSESQRCLNGGVWRQVSNLPEGTSKMFMRFATKSDIKIKGAGKYSKFYAAHGNPRIDNTKKYTTRPKREAVKRSFNKRNDNEEIDSRLVVYDDLPGEEEEKPISSRKLIYKSKSVSSDSDVAEGEDVETSPKKRKMISSMKLYSDRIEDDRNYSGRLRMDKKRSVHSRLG